MDIKELYKLYLNSTGVITDTRRIKKGSIYFALKGKNFNGNRFAKDALKKGAIAVVVDEEITGLEGRYFLVSDVLITLQKLARFHRDEFDIPVLGITGSNGKTTTKELIAGVLETRFKVHYTAGNFNNHIGVPLTILAMPKDTEIAIVEMGANHIGEIAELCTIANPNFGIITNIGKAHLEGFGSVEGIKQGKSELYKYVDSNKGVFFSNMEDPVLRSIIGSGQIRFQIPDLLPDSKYLKFDFGNHRFNTNLFGKYNLTNVAAAIAVGRYFKLDIKDIKRGIESYFPENNRSQLINFRGTTIVLDAYNANPNSMMESLSSFDAMNGRKMAVIGSMKELGSYEKEEHEKLVSYLKTTSIEKVILVGEEFHFVESIERFLCYKKVELIKEQVFYNYCKDYDFIILKGSRSNRLESLLEGHK